MKRMGVLGGNAANPASRRQVQPKKALWCGSGIRGRRARILQRPAQRPTRLPNARGKVRKPMQRKVKNRHDPRRRSPSDVAKSTERTATVVRSALFRLPWQVSRSFVVRRADLLPRRRRRQHTSENPERCRRQRQPRNGCNDEPPGQRVRHAFEHARIVEALDRAETIRHKKTPTEVGVFSVSEDRCLLVARARFELATFGL